MQENILLGILTSESVNTVMNNHFFTIGGRIYRQKDGSPIGLDISVEIASLVMLRWDSKFLAKARKLGIKIDLYKRYVDDILIILKEISPGWYFCTQANVMKFDKNHPTASMLPDARTFSILCALSNTLEKDIQMVSDVASDHDNGRLPVLDLELLIDNNRVEFSFYRKKCTSP